MPWPRRSRFRLPGVLMGWLDRNERWGLMCQRMFGLTVIGPDTRELIVAALIDGSNLRRTEDPDCADCPTVADKDFAVANNMQPPPKCDDHRLNDQVADAYEQVLSRLGSVMFGPDAKRLLDQMLAEGNPDGG